MEFWNEYGLFLAKAVTVLVVAGIILILFGGRERRGRERLEVKRLNDHYHTMEVALQRQLLNGKRLRQLLKFKRRERKQAEPRKRRVFVIDFQGDVRASQTDSLRQEISAVLTVAKAGDEVVVRLESPGGTVPGYGLAASQLARLRERDIRLTVAVDRVAASGGYLMACVADRILAAPFAILGSIGVVGQMPNFNRLLKEHNIDFELETAGEYKRTLTVFGQNDDEGRRKFREELEAVHDQFKTFVTRFRPSLSIDQVATGEHWLGERARELGLCDEVQTSDDYLQAASREATVLKVTYQRKPALGRRLSLAFETAMSRLLSSRGSLGGH